MSEPDSQKVYVAFDSPETAVRMTGGEAHTVRRVRDSNSAFILTDRKGQSFIYVKAEYSGYREVANRAAGEKIAVKGDDADHAGSRTVNSEQYVLLARVPKSANRSAGSVEKVTTLDGQFNRASLTPAPGGGYAAPMSARQAEKLSGRTREEYQTKSGRNAEPLEDKRIAVALLQTEQDQIRLNGMKGELLAKSKNLPTDRSYAEPAATDVTGPWDTQMKAKSTSQNQQTKDAFVRRSKTS